MNIEKKNTASIVNNTEPVSNVIRLGVRVVSLVGV